ncbi:flavin reductase family protein [Blastopirellula sp. J2-11]|uniref:flavin reductase family protein n=1 Tax=Blastopirellula sp. J2-11 TaxID=2943192 RepID=UPI0021C68A3A|nr:flavin reductase family protein [Blastopirellula sp. J2-11]UUO08608.1 flavin reductase family protein [Blastopirellula sp. J2-11]
MSDYYYYEPQQGHGLPHNPMNAIIAPRPIGWISSIDRQGKVNLAPYSFFNAFCYDPPIIGFSSGGPKDSQRNIAETGEFVFNLVTKKHAAAMNQTSFPFEHGINEFEQTGLTMSPSRLVQPPRVADTPVAFECKLLQMLPLKDLEGNPTPNTVIFGQVVAVHIDKAFLKEGLFDITAAGTVGRCGYLADYVEVKELFQMERPGE